MGAQEAPPPTPHPGNEILKKDRFMKAYSAGNVARGSDLTASVFALQGNLPLALQEHLSFY